MGYLQLSIKSMHPINLSYDFWGNATAVTVSLLLSLSQTACPTSAVPSYKSQERLGWVVRRFLLFIYLGGGTRNRFIKIGCLWQMQEGRQRNSAARMTKLSVALNSKSLFLAPAECPLSLDLHIITPADKWGSQSRASYPPKCWHCWGPGKRENCAQAL